VIRIKIEAITERIVPSKIILEIFTTYLLISGNRNTISAKNNGDPS
jgi:hypothetical protein